MNLREVPNETRRRSKHSKPRGRHEGPETLKQQAGLTSGSNARNGLVTPEAFTLMCAAQSRQQHSYACVLIHLGHLNPCALLLVPGRSFQRLYGWQASEGSRLAATTALP
mmetsp:Transcript_27974/g.88875  ORF Transcript_27974/g.88875 Transcript_27974/m.88875 type:complete len:110 (+) Transcript_27974:135-464(+)